MKTFLTKAEACEQLKRMERASMRCEDDVQCLASIRICILAEQKGLSLWGKDISMARPLFEQPERSAGTWNEEAYKQALAEALAYARCSLV